MYAQNPSHLAASDTAIQVPLNKCNLAHKKSLGNIFFQETVFLFYYTTVSDWLCPMSVSNKSAF